MPEYKNQYFRNSRDNQLLNNFICAHEIKYYWVTTVNANYTTAA